MLGIDGVRVLAAHEVDGEVELTVETTTAREWCRPCGVRAHSKGRPVVIVRDVDAFGRRARLRWIKRRWRCPERACPGGSWTEQHPALGPRMALTERARAAACRRVGRDGHSVAAVARDLAVGWHTVMRAVAGHGRPLIDDPDRVDGVRALGVDEASLLRTDPLPETWRRAAIRVGAPRRGKPPSFKLRCAATDAATATNRSGCERTRADAEAPLNCGNTLM